MSHHLSHATSRKVAGELVTYAPSFSVKDFKRTTTIAQIINKNNGKGK